MSKPCEHHWYWRRLRNQGFGYWECIVCGIKTGRVLLDVFGRPAQTAEEALRDV